MKTMFLFTAILFLCSWNTTIVAQEVADVVKEEEDGWKRGLSFGTDFTQLLQINPKVGAGEDRLGIGGTIGIFSN